MAVSFNTVAFTLARLAAAAVVSGVVLGAAVAPAKAQSVETRTLVVSTEGLNLAQPAGQSVLRHRLAVAAQRVCRDTDVHGLDMGDTYTACYTDAMNRAMAKGATLIAQAMSQSQVAGR